ncbi:MAG: DUF1614 domain-containing protein [Pseudomonadota bacterium]
MFSWPVSNIFLLIGLIALGILIFLIEVKAVSYAYEKAGISHRYVLAVLVLSLGGSVVNIPLARIGGQDIVVGHEVVRHMGTEYLVPIVKHVSGTLLAVNVGGALVPTVVSIYLLWKLPYLVPKAVVGILIMTGAMYGLATPVPGVGIAVPTLVPPILAAVIAMALDSRHAPPLAYACGTLGVLIGADLLNLSHVAGLGAPVASIGGAGTFDGVFLTGIIAVLLA